MQTEFELTDKLIVDFQTAINSEQQNEYYKSDPNFILSNFTSYPKSQIPTKVIVFLKSSNIEPLPHL